MARLSALGIITQVRSSTGGGRVYSLRKMHEMDRMDGMGGWNAHGRPGRLGNARSSRDSGIQGLRDSGIQGSNGHNYIVEYSTVYPRGVARWVRVLLAISSFGLMAHGSWLMAHRSWP